MMRRLLPPPPGSMTTDAPVGAPPARIINNAKKPPTRRASKEALRRGPSLRTIFFCLGVNRIDFSQEPFFGNINHIKLVFFLYETVHSDPDDMWYRICSGQWMHKHCFTTPCGDTDNGTTYNANGSGTGTSARFRYRYPLRGTGILWLCTRRICNPTCQIHQMRPVVHVKNAERPEGTAMSEKSARSRG
jgi:hypothetical protein